jgi:AraC family transcriptional activator of mtrCDE
MRIDRRLESGVFIRTNLAAGEATAASETQLICGRLRFEQVRNNMVLAALPPVVIICVDEGQDAERARTLVVAMTAELQADRMGAGAIAVDLASAVMMIVLRAHFESRATVPGILSLLANPQTGRALAAMFKDLLRPWTLDELAAIAQTSRATLVRLFRRHAGIAPLAFLSELRLDLARRRVRFEATALAEIAADAGYRSQSAFHRAFHRRFGVAPGSLRKGLD